MEVSIETYGCATNQADAEYMMGLLVERGFSVGGAGDVTIVNTCTVKAPTENKIRKRLKSLEAQGSRVVVAGCLPAAEPEIAGEFREFSFIGTNTQDVTEACESLVRGKRYVNISGGGGKLCLPKERINPGVEIIPILEGCLGSCSYCIVRRARGRLKSYPAGQIVGRVEQAVSDGVREIWLTSQDNGAYGKDFGSSLPELLEEVSAVDGDFMVRLGMANPDHVIGFLDELARAFEDERFYRFLHVPVQSGSDRVLSDMGRRYRVEEFMEIVRVFRKRFDATISSDVIAGYPTEDEDSFQETVSLVEKVEPDVLNISRFWPRPGTQAAKLKGLPGSETKRRSRILNKVFRRVGLERNNRWVGWEGRALVSERNSDGSYTARNSHYKPIVVRSSEDTFGGFADVKVEKATYFDLRGSLVNQA